MASLIPTYPEHLGTYALSLQSQAVGTCFETTFFQHVLHLPISADGWLLYYFSQPIFSEIQLLTVRFRHQ